MTIVPIIFYGTKLIRHTITIKPTVKPTILGFNVDADVDVEADADSHTHIHVHSIRSNWPIIY